MVLSTNPCRHTFGHCSFHRLFALSFSSRNLSSWGSVLPASWKEGQTLQNRGLSGASRAAGLTPGHRVREAIFVVGAALLASRQERVLAGVVNVSCLLLLSLPLLPEKT